MENQQKQMENLIGTVISDDKILQDKEFYLHITRSQLISLWKLANNNSIKTYGKKNLNSSIIIFLKESKNATGQLQIRKVL